LIIITEDFTGALAAVSSRALHLHGFLGALATVTVLAWWSPFSYAAPREHARGVEASRVARRRATTHRARRRRARARLTQQNA
jgi:hypothetical protein